MAHRRWFQPLNLELPEDIRHEDSIKEAIYDICELYKLKNVVGDAEKHTTEAGIEGVVVKFEVIYDDSED